MKRFCKSRQSEHRREVMTSGAVAIVMIAGFLPNVTEGNWQTGRLVWVGEGGGGGPARGGVWGGVMKVMKIARLKVKIGSCYPVDEPGPDEFGDQDFLRRTLHSLAWWLPSPLFCQSELDTGCIL